MAFNPNYTVSSYLTNYPASDSDDQLKHHSPRELEFMDAENPNQSLPRSGSQGSLSSDGTRKEFRQTNEYYRQPFPVQGRPMSSEEETEITYNKYEEPQEFNEMDQYSTYQRNYYNGGDFENDLDQRYCADVEMQGEPCLMDYVKIEESFERPRYENNEMQIENEGAEYNNQKIEESATMYDESTTICSDSDMSSQRYLSQYPIDTPGMIKSEAYSNTMMLEPSRNEHSPQQLQMSIRKNAVRLRELIEAIMQGVIPQESDLQGLNDIERTIVSCIREKKYKNLGVKTNKRREEKQKLFFKSALKFIENNFLSSFAKDRNLTRKKEADPLIFYVTYFQEVADAMRIDISNFLPPCQKRKYRAEGREIPSKNELKSFNLKYIELILTSKRFMAETLKYLDCSFVQTYAKSRYQKIDKVIEKIASVIDQICREFSRIYENNPAGFRDIAQRRVSEVLLNNSKSKLPWSNAELEETREFARVTIEKIAKNNANAFKA